MTKRNDQMGCITNNIAGVIGAAVGGWVLSLFGGISVTGFNLPSLLVAFVDAVIVLLVVHLIFGR